MMAHVLRQVTAVIGLMLKRPDALKSLDVSEKAFWDSFAAIILTAPLAMLAWVNAIVESNGQLTLAQLPRFAFVDLVGWVLPLGVVALAANTLQIADRLKPWVIAMNWSSLVISFLYIPLTLLTFGQGTTQLGVSLFLVVFVVSLMLSWRVQDAVLGKGAQRTFIVFMLGLLVALVSVVTLQGLLGLTVTLPDADQNFGAVVS